MGTLATSTFRVACLSAVGACDSPLLSVLQPWLDCYRPRHCPRRLRAHKVKAPLELDASTGAVKLVADVKWDVGKIGLG